MVFLERIFDFFGVNTGIENLEREIIMSDLTPTTVVINPSISSEYLDRLLDEFDYISKVLAHAKSNLPIYQRTEYSMATIHEVIGRLEYRKAELDIHIDALRTLLK